MNSIYDSNNSSKTNHINNDLLGNSHFEKTVSRDLEDRNQIACWFNFNKNSIFNSENFSGKKGSKSHEFPSKRWGHCCIVYNNNMYVFGGRYSSRNLANIFAFNLENFFWFKIEPIGQIPPARDSHSMILVNNEVISFGGCGLGRKMKDFWSFNLESRKWSKISSTGESPCARDGHCCGLIKGKYMFIHGGIDESDVILSDVYVYEIQKTRWLKLLNEGDLPARRDSQTCAVIKDICYLFGGQGQKDELYNDLYIFEIIIDEENKSTSKAIWKSIEANGKKPLPRSSHSCNTYKDEYLIIIGGEGIIENNKFPLNDIWLFKVSNSTWFQLTPSNSDLFDARFCHSSVIVGEKIFIFGGMKNAEETLDNLSILCLNGDLKSFDTENLINNDNLSNNSNMQSVEEYNENLNSYLKKNEEKIITVSNALVNPKSLGKKGEASTANKLTDTLDLYDDNKFDLEILKRNFINPLFSWTMLEKISDFNLWPLACLGNLVENPLKKEVQAQNIEVDLKIFYREKNSIADSLTNKFEDKEVKSDKYWEKKTQFLTLINQNIFQNFTNINNSTVNANAKKSEFAFNDVKITNCKEFLLNSYSPDLNPDKALNYTEKLTPVLIIKDDGKGIPALDFNQILFSFSTNEKKEFSFFKFGMTLKTSAIRLCDSMLLLSKTDTEINIGLISKNLQARVGSDFIITPIVNFSYTKNYLNPKSVFYLQTLYFIFEEISFIFPSFESLLDYAKSFSTGTHIFLYDLREIKNFENNFYSSCSELNRLIDLEENFLKSFELYFDLENKDIVYSHFENMVPDRKIIDCAFSTYMKFLFLKQSEDLNFSLFGKKISLVNPLLCLFNISKGFSEILKIKQNLRAADAKPENAILIDNEIYKGILFNENFLTNIKKESLYENIILQSDCVMNGILFYCDNRLISRMDQNRLGDVGYFLKKMGKMQKKLRENKTKTEGLANNKDPYENNLFYISGFLEIPKEKYPLLHNKTEFKDQHIIGFLISKLARLLNKLELK